jgi:ATP-dependent Lon protease
MVKRLGKDTEDKQGIKLPAVCVCDKVIFPHMISTVIIKEQEFKKIEKKFSNKNKEDRIIFVTSYKDCEKINIEKQKIFFKYGSVCTIINKRDFSDGRVKLLVQGCYKAYLDKISKNEGLLYATIKPIEDLAVDNKSADAEHIKGKIFSYIDNLNKAGEIFAPELLLLCEDIEDIAKLSDMIAAYISLNIKDSRELLLISDPIARLNRIYDLLIINKPQSLSYIGNSVNNFFTEKDFRSQMQSLRNTSEDGEEGNELRELWQKVHILKMPESVKSEISKSLKRLEKMHQEGSEAVMTRNHIETVLSLPWGKFTQDKIDLKEAKFILDEQHYSLENVKDRIIEFLAVRKLNPKAKSPILCFVGPPGVGKTSLGKSIASSLGRRFVRISLGGIRDEADVRGHRKTYVGAYPGRIMQALKSIDSLNPVIVLDEIDKIGSGSRGDPSAALLEILDPEQNNKFIDHYLNIEFDLSKVLFISNANSLNNLAAPLLDRLEIIEISGYSEEEKLVIAKKYLVPRCVSEAGLNLDKVEFKEEALQAIIRTYTRENGLRSLNKKLEAICRKLARKVAESAKQDQSLVIRKNDLLELLGHSIYSRIAVGNSSVVGLSCALAYTQTGGEILLIETKILKGKSSLVLTGSLGKVMQESALTAFNYIKSQNKFFKIDMKNFQDKEIHVHLPQGAVSKEGPSAGVALACSILSALLDRPLNTGITMTGEISLHGQVLPVGGVREKILAAKREGFKTLILPLENKAHYNSLSKDIKDFFKVHFVSSFEEVFIIIFAKDTVVEDSFQL